ncbi:hypothetical protein L1887_03402 [Cichorium endivia]|nr:hypothetical protein L1887_03402 [Cichorium endivia]
MYSSLPCRSLFVGEDPTNAHDRSKIAGSAPLDLNRAPCTLSEAGGSIFDEVRANIRVSKEVGFQIDVGNDILNEVMGVQETWISDHSRINIVVCWDSPDFDFDGVDSTGRSGV